MVRTCVLEGYPNSCFLHRYVLECCNCGIIYRSRQYWYGNQDPEKSVVRTEIRHVWPGVSLRTVLLSLLGNSLWSPSAGLAVSPTLNNPQSGAQIVYKMFFSC